MATKVTVITSGPFFEKDPKLTFRQNVRTMLRAMADEGQADVIAQLTSGESERVPISALNDRVSQHVTARVESLTGKKWALTAVVSVNNSGFTRTEGISLMAAASNLERRFHAFRTTTRRLRASRAVQTAELTKGLE